MPFVDTNIFIRYLTRDDPEKAQACLQLFKQAEANQISLITTEVVIAEVVYVLSSKRLYNLARGAIRARLYPLLSLIGLSISDREATFRALDLYTATSLDFEDTLIVAHMENGQTNELYSYDRGFDHISSISRLEP